MSMSQPKFGFLQIWVCLGVLVDQQHQRTPATSPATTSIADRLPPVMNFGCRSHHFGGTNGFGTTRLLGSAETTHKKTQNGPPNAEHWSKRQIIYMQNGKWNSGQLHTLRIICQHDVVYLQSQLLTSGTKFSTTGSVAVVPKVPWACETSGRDGNHHDTVNDTSSNLLVIW